MAAITNQQIIAGVNQVGYKKVGNDVYFGGRERVIPVPDTSNLSVLRPSMIAVFTDTIEGINLEIDPTISSASVRLNRALISSAGLTLEQIRSLPR